MKQRYISAVVLHKVNKVINVKETLVYFVKPNESNTSIKV